MNPLQQPGFSRWSGAVTLAIGLLVSGVGLAAPRPSISSISPDSAIAGMPGFELVVFGDNFDSSSRLLWNGAVRATSCQLFREPTGSRHPLQRHRQRGQSRRLGDESGPGWDRNFKSSSVHH